MNIVKWVAKNFYLLLVYFRMMKSMEIFGIV
jgi:hypothetical protein